MNLKQKYLKYKQKYLNLAGGAAVKMNPYEYFLEILRSDEGILDRDNQINWINFYKSENLAYLILGFDRSQSREDLKAQCKARLLEIIQEPDNKMLTLLLASVSVVMTQNDESVSSLPKASVEVSAGGPMQVLMPHGYTPPSLRYGETIAQYSSAIKKYDLPKLKSQLTDCAKLGRNRELLEILKLVRELHTDISEFLNKSLMKDDRPNYPLHNACSGTMIECQDTVKILLCNGADINLKNNKGDTPLHCAYFYGNLQIAQILIENGADVDILDNKNKTYDDEDYTEDEEKYLNFNIEKIHFRKNPIQCDFYEGRIARE